MAREGILIEGGMLVDGTGSPAHRADILVEGDRIKAVLDPKESSALRSASQVETIDATGCLVTPGFIDAHSHSDTYLLIEPSAPSKISQGITTEINGQCGGSAVPRLGVARLSSDWASMVYPGGNGEPGPTWRTMAEYRSLLESVRPLINTVQFVGHNTLRSSVIGYDALKATPDTQREMERLLARELDDGGWGVTTGLIYQPGKYSDSAEVVSLAKVAAARGGYYATHMRSEGDRIIEAIDEVLDLVRATGIRAEISHLKTSGRDNWGKIDAVLSKMDDAVETGLLLGSDRYPYCAAGTDLDVVFPDWAGVGGLLAELKRLDDPATRKRIADEITSSGREWSSVMIGGTWSEETARYSGRTIADIMTEEGASRTAGELICDILVADKGRTGGFFFSMSEENLHRICERPWIVPGSDASLRAPWGPLGKDHPHPRAYSTMPRFFRLLTGRLEGHAPICSLEESVRRMTSIPAERFGIARRGTLRTGCFADIAIWKEEEFRETSTFVKPHSWCGGMKVVMVNGHISYRDGKFAGSGCGRFLERS